MLAESLVYARSFWRTPTPFRPHLAEADRDAPGFAYSLGTSGTNNPYGSRS